MQMILKGQMKKCFFPDELRKDVYVVEFGRMKTRVVRVLLMVIM